MGLLSRGGRVPFRSPRPTSRLPSLTGLPSAQLSLGPRAASYQLSELSQSLCFDHYKLL